MYGKSAEQVAFFVAHEERGAKVTPIDEILLTRYHTPEDHVVRRINFPYLDTNFSLYSYIFDVKQAYSDT